ncbi:MAG: pseudouridine synthase [Mesorhizobium sp.]
MDDERKKGPRKGGGKSSAATRGGGRTGRPGKGGFGGKPYAAKGKKPFRERSADAGGQPAKRPQREFGSNDRSREERNKRPGRFERAERSSGDAAASDRSGRPPREQQGPGDRPYVKRAPRDGERPSGERPFRRDDRPRDGGDKRPGRFERAERNAGDAATSNRSGRPPREQQGAGDRPYVKRAPRDGERPLGERPFRRDDRPRDGGDKRPGRFERAERNAGDAATSERTFRPARERHGSDGEAKRPWRDGERSSGEKPFERGKRPFAGGGKAGADRPDRRPKPAGEGSRKPFARRSEAASEGEGERIAKRLARAGIASRRDAEELIAAGRIKVNGKVLSSPAFNVSPDDRIELDGMEIPPIERTRLFLFHKPAGVVTTNRDPEGRKTVFDVLPKELPRLMTIGRLDINTEGLLLLTNDGGLARVLELPATGWLRRYRVRVHGAPDEKALVDLKNGIAVDGVFYGSIEATLDRQQGTNAWLTIGLREGKNREVKNILGALGLEVTRLIRISYGPFQLGELLEGHVWEMKGRTLRDQLGERLIEEAGANFEAEIAKPFSNKPERREPRHPEEPKMAHREERERIGEGGLIKNRKRDRDDRREDALGRLSTKRDKGQGRGFGGKPGDRAERRDEPTRARTANVWMAPGARPQGKKKDASASTTPSSRMNREGAGKEPRGKQSFGKGPGRERGSSSAFRSPSPGSGRRDGNARPPRGKGPGKGPKGR